MRNLGFLFIALLISGFTVMRAQDSMQIYPPLTADSTFFKLFINQADQVTLTIYDRWGVVERQFLQDSLLQVGKYTFGHSCKKNGQYFVSFKTHHSGSKNGIFGKDSNFKVSNDKIVFKKSLPVYPNPADELLTVILPDAVLNKSCAISICNMQGKLIKTYNYLAICNNYELATALLGSGNYVLIMESEGVEFRSVFAVQH